MILLSVIIIIATMEDDRNENENEDDIIDFRRPKRYTTPERRGTLYISSDNLATVRRINCLLESNEECQMLLLFLVACLCHLVKSKATVSSKLPPTLFFTCKISIEADRSKKVR